MAFLNRSRFEIMARILQKATPGAKKTWLLYSANLSFSQYQRYLKTLTHLGLITKKGSLYTTTEKGLAFLESYRELVSILETPESLAEDFKKESREGMGGSKGATLSAARDHDIETKILNARDI